jgi:hypothetical protein
VGRLRGSGVGVAEFAHIQSEIAAGRPICARIVRDDDKNGRVDGAHFVVIVGWKIQDGTPHVSIADPLLESSEWMPLETFCTNYRFQGVWQATYYMKD